MNEYIIPSTQVRAPADHHKLFYLVLIFGVIAVATVLLGFYGKPVIRQTSPAINDQIAIKRALLSMSSYNPPANLTSTEIDYKKILLNKPNPQANLSTDQIKVKRAILESE